MVNSSLDLAAYLGIPEWLLAIVVLWSVAWMGVAMWKSAKKNHLIWFVIFLLVHTLGILEILYIFVFSKMSPDKKPAAQNKPRRRR